MNCSLKLILGTAAASLLLAGTVLPAMAAPAEEVPKGYVDPVQEFGLTAGMEKRAILDALWEPADPESTELTRRDVSELYLVPFQVWRDDNALLLSLSEGDRNALLNALGTQSLHYGVPYTGDPLILGEEPQTYTAEAELHQGNDGLSGSGPVGVRYDSRLRLEFKDLQYVPQEETSKFFYDYTDGSGSVSSRLLYRLGQGAPESLEFTSGFAVPEDQVGLVASEHTDAPCRLSYRMSEDGQHLIARLSAFDARDQREAAIDFYVTGVKYENRILPAAGARPDENRGASLWKVLLLGVGGAGAALLAVAVSGGAKAPAAPDPREDGVYKLYFRKDFGDRIRKGGKARSVSAHIVKLLPDGRMDRRRELTENIVIRGGKYLRVGEPRISGGRQTVDLWAAADCPAEVTEENLEIVYTGEEGTYTQHVRFELVGEPALVFPGQAPGAESMEIVAIAGDGITYHVPFLLDNALEAPRNIEFLCDDPGVHISAEHLKDYSYEAIVRNGSQPMEDRVLGVEKRVRVEISAQCGEDRFAGSFTIVFYPEGISVLARSGGSRLAVRSWEDPEKGMVPTRFRPVLAVREELPDGRQRAILADLCQAEFSVGEPVPLSERTQVLLSRCPVQVTDTICEDGTCTLRPGRNLPAFYEAEDPARKEPRPYEVMVPLRCRYGEKDYSLDLTCALQGETLPAPGSRAQELEQFRGIAERYLPEDLANRVLEALGEQGDHQSALTLHQMSASILREAMLRFTVPGRADRPWTAALAWMGGDAAWVRWISGCAFAHAAEKHKNLAGEPFLGHLRRLTDAAGSALAEPLLRGETVDCGSLDCLKKAADAAARALCGYREADRDSADPMAREEAAAAMSFFCTQALLGRCNELAAAGDPEQAPYPEALLELLSDLTPAAMETMAAAGIRTLLDREPVREALITGTVLRLRTRMEERFRENLSEQPGAEPLPQPLLTAVQSAEKEKPAEEEPPKKQWTLEEIAALDRDYFGRFFSGSAGAEMLTGVLGEGAARFLTRPDAGTAGDPNTVTAPFLAPAEGEETGVYLELDLGQALENEGLRELLWKSLFARLTWAREPGDLPAELPLPADTK